MWHFLQDIILSVTEGAEEELEDRLEISINLSPPFRRMMETILRNQETSVFPVPPPPTEGVAMGIKLVADILLNLMFTWSFMLRVTCHDIPRLLCCDNVNDFISFTVPLRLIIVHSKLHYSTRSHYYATQVVLQCLLCCCCLLCWMAGGLKLKRSELLNISYFPCYSFVTVRRLWSLLP